MLTQTSLPIRPILSGLCLVAASLSMAACAKAPDITSDTVPKKQIMAINARIDKLYPDIADSLEGQVLAVAVKAIEDLVHIEGGSFMMGDFKAPCDPVDPRLMEWTPDAECYTSTFAIKTGSAFQHKVTLSSYSLAKFETTYQGFDAFQLVRGLDVVKGKLRREYNLPAKQFANKPTPTKYWQEAKDYCRWLGDLTAMPFDLPTEAQWEYAARNRGQNIYYATNNGQIINGHRPHRLLDEKGRLYHKQFEKTEWNYNGGLNLTKVGILPPNPLGLYDMAGNASEWVNDWFSADYYKTSPEHNPQGPDTGEEKVIRGAADDRPMTTDRGSENPVQDNYYSIHSFRCALQQEAPAL